MRVHGIFYGQFARPGFCRRFKEVVVPTSETILKTIQMLVTQGDTTTYDSLHRVDLDLDRRVKELMTSTALQKMRLEMAEQIKREILEGPLVDEISQRVYQELKSAKESEGQDFKWGQQ